MRLLRKSNKQEDGQILILVLLVLVLSSLMVGPLVNLMGTGLQAVRVYHDKTAQLYAADAGLQYGLWKIVNGQAPTYPSSVTYPAITVNDKSVVVKIDAIWILEGIVDSDRQGPNNYLETVIGQPDASGLYVVDITYTGSGNKKIENMGVWLPTGFTYVTGSCGTFPGNITTNAPSITQMRCGTSLKWTGLSYSLKDNPHCTQSFRFTPPTPGAIPKGDIAWTETTPQDIGLSYDTSMCSYTITSTATNSSSGKHCTVVAQVSSNTGSTPGAAIVSFEIDPPGT